VPIDKTSNASGREAANVTGALKNDYMLSEK
jgi:hypothetical protein